MEFPDRNPFLVLRTTVPRMTRVADVGQSGFYSTGSKRRHQRTQDVRSCKKLSFATAIVTGRYVPDAVFGAWQNRPFLDAQAPFFRREVRSVCFFIFGGQGWPIPAYRLRNKSFRTDAMPRQMTRPCRAQPGLDDAQVEVRAARPPPPPRWEAIFPPSTTICAAVI